MSWLVGLIEKYFLNWLLEKVSAVISLWNKDKANHETAVNQAAQDVKKAKELKPDATAEETDAAIDDELGHF